MSETGGYEINEENGIIKNLNVGELLGRPLAERQVAAEKLKKVYAQLSVTATEDRFLLTYVIYKLKMAEKNYSEALIYNLIGLKTIPEVVGKFTKTSEKVQHFAIESFYRDFTEIAADTVPNEEKLRVISEGLSYVKNNQSLRAKRAALYYMTGKLDAAHAECTKLISENYQDSMIFVQRGIINMIKNNKVEAQADLAAARVLAPECTTAAYYQGYIDREALSNNYHSPAAVRRFFESRAHII